MRLSKKCGGISLTAKITEDSIKRNHDREKYKTTLGEKMKFKKKNKNQKFSFLFFFTFYLSMLLHKNGVD